MRCEDVFGEGLRIFREVDARQILRTVQALVYQGHRMHTIFHITKNLHGFLVFCVHGLKVEETADYRQIVLDPVMNLPQESFFPLLTGAQCGGHLL